MEATRLVTSSKKTIIRIHLSAAFFMVYNMDPINEIPPINVSITSTSRIPRVLDLRIWW